jgi:hypothetical protein
MRKDDPKPLSFARDIRPMFTDLDTEHMRPQGIDLSSRDEVAARGDDIYAEVSAGTMPPRSSGEARWTPEMCATFKLWQTQGCPS